MSEVFYCRTVVVLGAQQAENRIFRRSVGVHGAAGHRPGLPNSDGPRLSTNVQLYSNIQNFAHNHIHHRFDLFVTCQPLKGV